jgi:hypothetical protein
MTKSYRSSLIFRVMMPTPVSCLVGSKKHVPAGPAVTAVTNFAIGGRPDASSAYPGSLHRRGLVDEERDPNHGKGNDRGRNCGCGHEQRVEAFRRNIAQHGVLAWLMRARLKRHDCRRSSVNQVTRRAAGMLLGRGRRRKLSTEADSTSPAGPARRMFPFLGWGEAALDVRFMSAHQGRQLVRAS